MSKDVNNMTKIMCLESHSKWLRFLNLSVYPVSWLNIVKFQLIVMVSATVAGMVQIIHVRQYCQY